MVSESGDIKHYLSQLALFQHLLPSVLDTLCEGVLTAFAKTGEHLPFADTPPQSLPGLLVIRSGSLEIRDAENRLVDRLGDGDFLVPQAFREPECLEFRVRVLEDCLYYEIGRDAYTSVYQRESYFAYLADRAVMQLKAAEEHPEPVRTPKPGEARNYLDQRVRDTMARPAVCADPAISVCEAAKMMSDRNISSLLIVENGVLRGIVTDRDLRTRVLARDADARQSIDNIMSPDPHSIDADAPLHQAQLLMMASHIHHLPVLEQSRPVGLISLSDIVRANNIEPISLTGSVRHATSVEALQEIAERIPELVVALIKRDTRAVDVGEIISSVTDAITRRLLALAEQQLGSPPCRYSWMAFGSQARQEQMLVSDQDNALIIENGNRDRADRYFERLAEFVNDGLNKCGVEMCPGGIMARNQQWRMELDDWREKFGVWIEQPDPKALMHASIFFDLRHIGGDREMTAELQHDILSRARGNTIFLALMCDNALKHSPPLGFFKTLVLETDGDHNKYLDLKKRGTIPIVDIARTYALSAGLAAVTTNQRLQAIAETKAMSQSLVDSLTDAHEFIAGVRLHAQANHYDSKEPVDNRLDPTSLSALMRHQLKDAFYLVRQAQAAMKAKFGGGYL